MTEAFDQTILDEVVDVVRNALGDIPNVIEKRIVGGGLGFMVDGHLCCGVSPRGLTVRVGPDGKADAVALPNVEPLRLGKRETAAFVVVALEALVGPSSIDQWVARGLEFVATLD